MKPTIQAGGALAVTGFSLDPTKLETAALLLRRNRDLSLYGPSEIAGDYFPELENFVLGFPEVRQAFAAHMDSVQAYYNRAFTCVDDLFRGSLAAAIRYENIDADYAEFLLTEPFE